MSEGLIIGIDVGTQSVRALLADAAGRTLACVRRPTPSRRIGEYSAEYDPDVLWSCVIELVRELAQHVPKGQVVAGISCASMGESCVLVGVGGEALAPALAWFDRRTEADAEEVAALIGEDRLFEITGYPPDSTLTLCKLLWHRRSQPDCFAHLKLVLPISPWIAFKLCGVAAVDPSLAARTLCLDVNTGTWSDELLGAFGLKSSLFPPIMPSGTPLGPVLPSVLRQTGLAGAPMVCVGAQDHIAGGFAAGATRPGVFLDSLGTSEAILVTTDRPKLKLDDRRFGFVQTSAALDERFYLIGSGLNRSGGAIEWALRTIAPGIPRQDLLEEAMAEPAGNGGVIFVPNLAGSTAPSPDGGAAGAFIGLTDATRRASLLRAVFEGVAMEARLVSDALFELPGVGQPDDFRLIGGSTRNPLFLEIKASVLGRTLTVYDEPEMTAVGAALLGGLGAGLWPDFATAASELSLPVRKVAPNPAWRRVYETLYGSVYRDLHHSLASANRSLANYRAAGAAKAEGGSA
ncbi:L-fuculokinase [Rhizobium sp. NPDC090275]|uniref:FGGY-family carbohydrate kinase n=1 Tax=Rhizobium sp. NPDC090275 TaxID=3364498 RepID=UPI00383B3991